MPIGWRPSMLAVELFHSETRVCSFLTCHVSLFFCLQPPTSFSSGVFSRSPMHSGMSRIGTPDLRGASTTPRFSSGLGPLCVLVITIFDVHILITIIKVVIRMAFISIYPRPARGLDHPSLLVRARTTVCARYYYIRYSYYYHYSRHNDSVYRSLPPTCVGPRPPLASRPGSDHCARPCRW